MPLETELKLRVDSHDDVRRRLRELGAEHIESVVETNRIYDRPDGSLSRRGCGLRLRSAVVEDGVQIRATLTFKGPLLSPTLKSREELEVDVADPEALEQLMEEIGFSRILCYQKRRESWRLDACKVELDEPPHIGLFVEIEGPNERAIRDVQRKLRLDTTHHVAASYVGMLLAYCEADGLSHRSLHL